MDNKLINNDNEIDNIFDNIKELVINSRNKVYSAVNTEMLNLYWNIGKIIMEIQQGDERASYGDAVLEKLSEKLTNEFGKGFSKRNLERMRKFYICFPIATTVSSQLSWSHYLEIIKIEEEQKRNFYIKETINSKWSVRELQRQRDSLLYERLTLSADKEKVLELSLKGQILKTSKDLVKDPFVLEFLDIKENTDYLESDLEKNIIEHLKEFLLELGKGFSYVGNQVRLTLEEDYFYPDLVFYNRLLRCFVIIDLKIGKVSHQDIGQMQMYVNYYDREIKQDDENPTVGILLSTNKIDTKDYKIFDKKIYSSLNDELKKYLIENNIDEIYLCGFDTDACVFKTALDLFENDYNVYVLKDYCMSGKSVELHNVYINNLARLIGKDRII